MSRKRKYTAEDMAQWASMVRRDALPAGKSTWRLTVAPLLEQAAATEARVMGLVEFIERAYREGFRDGSVDCVADERGLGGVGEDAYWSGSNASEALSKHRGEDA